MKPHQAVLLVLFVLVVLGGGLLLTSHDVRMKVLGVDIRYAPVAQAKQKLLLVLRIAEGREVQGETAQPSVDASEESALTAEIEETVQGVSNTEYELLYKLSQMRSEQFAWRQDKSSKLLDATWSAHVAARGPLTDCKVVGDNRSPWLQTQNLEGWLSALWLGLPRDHARIGDAWASDVQVPLKVREFHDPLMIQQHFNYILTKVYEQGGIALAQIEWNGTVSALSPAVGNGTLSGAAVFALDRKLCLQADFSLDQDIHAPISGLPGSEDDPIVFAYHQKQHGTVTRLGN